MRIRPKGLPDCDCSPWQKVKEQIQALYERVTQLGQKDNELQEELDRCGEDVIDLDDRVTLLENRPATTAWGAITGTLADQTDLMTELNKKADTANLAGVAFTGDYDDLSDKPVIDSALSNTSENAIQNKVITQALYARASILYGIREPTEDPVASTITYAGVFYVDRGLGDLYVSGERNPITLVAVWHKLCTIEELQSLETTINSALLGKANMTVGTADPTGSVSGALGDFYFNSTNGKLFQCTAVASNVSTWTEIGGSGGIEVLNVKWVDSNTCLFNGASKTWGEVIDALRDGYGVKPIVYTNRNERTGLVYRAVIRSGGNQNLFYANCGWTGISGYQDSQLYFNYNSSTGVWSAIDATDNLTLPAAPVMVNKNVQNWADKLTYADPAKTLYIMQAEWDTAYDPQSWGLALLTNKVFVGDGYEWVSKDGERMRFTSYEITYYNPTTSENYQLQSSDVDTVTTFFTAIVG